MTNVLQGVLTDMVQGKDASTVLLNNEAENKKLEDKNAQSITAVDGWVTVNKNAILSLANIIGTLENIETSVHVETKRLRDKVIAKVSRMDLRFT